MVLCPSYDSLEPAYVAPPTTQPEGEFRGVFVELSDSSDEELIQEPSPIELSDDEVVQEAPVIVISDDE